MMDPDKSSCVLRYTPQSIELEHSLKPFIPDYIPAVGDIDAFLKVTPLFFPRLCANFLLASFTVSCPFLRCQDQMRSLTTLGCWFWTSPVSNSRTPR